VLGIGIRDPETFRFSPSAHDALHDIRELGGAAFAAHPTSARPDFKWAGWDLPGSWGLEVWNGDSQWRASGLLQRLRAVAAYSLNENYALLTLITRPRDEIGMWDRLLASRHVPALAGSDSHGQVRIGAGVSLPVLSYASLFRMLQNHVLLESRLTGDVQTDIDAIRDALRRGRSYMSVEGLAPGRDFSFVAERGDKRWTMGDTVPFEPGIRFRVSGRMPANALVSLLKDGAPVSATAAPLDWPVAEPGVYRIEVHLDGWSFPWIISNPIYVFDRETAQRRWQREAVPSDSIVPPRVVVIEDFEGETTFQAAADGSSRASATREAVSPPENATATRVDFALGRDAAQSPFAALVSSVPRDLSGRSGLVLSIRSDRAYRLWVQLRNPNPDANEGTEWWQTSIKTSTEWTRLVVPFERFQTVESQSGGILDLANIVAMLFIIDSGSVPPGTTGTVWIDDLGVY
jgi:hypothetical protein